MNLSGIQLAALRAAKRGDWQLADAIEVKQRVEHAGAVCGFMRGGRLGGFVYSAEEDGVPDQFIDCPHCTEGRLANGELCHSCEGRGWRERNLLTALSGDEQFLDLNGEPVRISLFEVLQAPGELFPGWTASAGLLTLTWAERVIAEYQDGLAKPPVQGTIFPMAEVA